MTKAMIVGGPHAGQCYESRGMGDRLFLAVPMKLPAVVDAAAFDAALPLEVSFHRANYRLHTMAWSNGHSNGDYDNVRRSFWIPDVGAPDFARDSAFVIDKLVKAYRPEPEGETAEDRFFRLSRKIEVVTDEADKAWDALLAETRAARKAVQEAS